MMPNLRFQSSYALTVLLALGACTLPERDASNQEVDHGRGDDGAAPPDAGVSVPHDASNDPDDPPTPPDAMPGDTGGGGTGGGGTGGGGTGGGGTGGGGTGGDTGSIGVISCYSEGSPDAMCTLPTHCCFTNYSAQHNGACMIESCSWGTIECDGPEDCASGQYCCSHALSFGYKISCQNSACGPAPANQELCHPTSSPAGTCSSASSCVSTFGNNNDLPRTLYICQ